VLQDAGIKIDSVASSIAAKVVTSQAGLTPSWRAPPRHHRQL